MNQSSTLPDGCPPKDAKPASGVMYRFVKQDPPTPHDFLSWRELYPGKPCPQGTTECSACGVSIFAVKDELAQLPKRVPKFRKQKIALGNLNPNLGVVMGHKNTSHHDWWPPQDSKPWAVFRVI
jgi:hypothetical protein